MSEDLFWRRAVVFGSAFLYWAGVLAQARRVRRHIGRSPNLRPRGPKEKLLWTGWFLVIVVWIAQPFFIGIDTLPPWLQIVPSALHPLGFALGIMAVAAGYAGTLWCYAAMGDTWRIGINRREKNPLVTRGPYRVVRHPIYLFQIVMLAGVLLLLPTVLSVSILVIHLLCVLAKASDEESYLLTVHGDEYRRVPLPHGKVVPEMDQENITSQVRRVLSSIPQSHHTEELLGVG